MHVSLCAAKATVGRTRGIKPTQFPLKIPRCVLRMASASSAVLGAPRHVLMQIRSASSTPSSANAILYVKLMWSFRHPRVAVSSARHAPYRANECGSARQIGIRSAKSVPRILIRAARTPQSAYRARPDCSDGSGRQIAAHHQTSNRVWNAQRVTTGRCETAMGTASHVLQACAAATTAPRASGTRNASPEKFQCRRTAAYALCANARTTRIRSKRRVSHALPVP